MNGADEKEMLKKNESIVLNITDIGVNGEGIGKTEGYTFFVKDAMIGDTVSAIITKMKKGYGYARLIEVLKPSTGRITAPCEHARRCGGCQIMEMNYEEQLRFKERKVKNNLEKIGGLKGIEVLPIIGMDLSENLTHVPLHYRNKMQFPIGRDKEGNIVAGFYAGRTHSIIDTSECLVSSEAGNRILQAVKEFLREHHISVYNEVTGQGLVRHLILREGFRTGEIMVCLVLNGESLNDGSYTHNVDIDALFVDKVLKCPLPTMSDDGSELPRKVCSICINTNKEQTNVITGRKVRCLYGREYIYDEIRSADGEKALKFKISPLSFYQVNPLQTEKLYAKALEFAGLSGNENVWDLYCGIGTISLFLAQNAGHVTGVEIVPDAIRDAKENAQLNQIQNAEFLCGRSEDVFPMYVSGKRTDYYPDPETEQADGPELGTEEPLVVVLDPPRKGCDRVLLNAIRAVGPDKIVYISCDSATLARDLKILSGKSDEDSTDQEKQSSYRIEKIQPVDMFPNSVHVETVVLMSRVKD